MRKAVLIDQRPEVRQRPDRGTSLTLGYRENGEGVRTQPRVRNHDDGGGTLALNCLVFSRIVSTVGHLADSGIGLRGPR